MFADMACKCGSAIQLDGFNDALTEFTVVRFLEAHIVCGFVTPVKSDDPEKTSRRNMDVKRRVFKEDDED